MSSASQPLGVSEILQSLARHKVDYVLIGGVAMQAHGHVRTTQDLDVIAAWTPENLGRLAGALRELGAELRGLDAHLRGIDLGDPDDLYNGGNFLMHTRHGDLDVFAIDQTAGAPSSYERLRERAISVQLGPVMLLVAHPEDLIRMKAAASSFRDRPQAKRRQDLDDIAVLERLRGEQDAALAARLASTGQSPLGPSAPRSSDAPARPSGPAPHAPRNGPARGR